MTLNPSAQVFIPSSQTLRLLKGTSTPAVEPVKAAVVQEFSPPQLESLYIDTSGSRGDEDMFNLQAQPVSSTIDYTNFDLPFFFHDMMSAGSDDFKNYLSDRAEYLLGYAGTSELHALEIVDTILDTVYNLLKKNGREFKRPLELAAEMCDMDQTFLQIMLQQMIRLLEYLHNPVTRDPAFSVLFGLMLRELHIGSCRASPETPLGFADEVCELFLRLLQDRRYNDATLYTLEQCESQLKCICRPQHIEAICASLRKISARSTSMDCLRKCSGLQKRLSQHTPNDCLKTHAMPVAQLNDEEAEDFEAFLMESRRSFPQCRS